MLIGGSLRKLGRVVFDFPPWQSVRAQYFREVSEREVASPSRDLFGGNLSQIFYKVMWTRRFFTFTESILKCVCAWWSDLKLERWIVSNAWFGMGVRPNIMFWQKTLTGRNHKSPSINGGTGRTLVLYYVNFEVGLPVRPLQIGQRTSLLPRPAKNALL